MTTAAVATTLRNHKAAMNHRKAAHGHGVEDSSSAKLFSIDFWEARTGDGAATEEAVARSFKPLQEDAAYHDLTDFSVVPARFDSAVVVGKGDEEHEQPGPGNTSGGSTSFTAAGSRTASSSSTSKNTTPATTFKAAPSLPSGPTFLVESRKEEEEGPAPRSSLLVGGRLFGGTSAKSSRASSHRLPTLTEEEESASTLPAILQGLRTKKESIAGEDGSYVPDAKQQQEQVASSKTDFTSMAEDLLRRMRISEDKENIGGGPSNLPRTSSGRIQSGRLTLQYE
ncbi:unnamed protein product [Amoebophrya sp. A25]|nr:unnamed protein product [Amoebophrya sp. A25]|eukprot:GSA25T00004652001.1